MKTVRNNKGAVLIFILIVNAVLIVTSTALLSTVVMDFKMKKIHSKVKKTFYYAESGLDEAYAITLDFFDTAIDFLGEELEQRWIINIDEEFIRIIKGESWCYDKKVSLKSLLENKDNYSMNEAHCSTITANFSKKYGCYTLNIKSTYKDGKIERSVSATYDVLLPGDSIGLPYITAEDLLKRKVWAIPERES